MASADDMLQSNDDVALADDLSSFQDGLNPGQHQLPDWVVDQPVTPEKDTVPDVMDFLADLATRRRALLQLLQRKV